MTLNNGESVHMMFDLRSLIVCEHASARFGGEAALPLHYYRVLKERKVDVWLITHARTRPELNEIYPDDPNIFYIEDNRFHQLMSWASEKMPERAANMTFGFASRLASQLTQRRLVRQLVMSKGISVIHQPMPVSPREPSMMYGFGVPVIIGPMNGGIDYPPAFKSHQSALVTSLLKSGRAFSGILNQVIPGKRRSARLLVANTRTRKALPPGLNVPIIELVENGVDMKVWSHSVTATETYQPVTKLLFMGRLVGWKAVDLLLEAFHLTHRKASITLTLAGDGPERVKLEAKARSMGLLASIEGEQGKVFFAGWKTQKACAGLLASSHVLILPSLMECGGAVVLEAMAAKKPVIATGWGGPVDYLDSTCGILVPPTSQEDFVKGLADAILKLAGNPTLQKEMGEAGYRRIEDHFDWEVKIDRVIQIYEDVVKI